MTNRESINIPYEKFYLTNGMKCILYKRREIHSVTVRVNVNVGSLDETDTTNGLSHFVEHAVHEATVELDTWEKVEDFKNRYSASTNAYTSLDHTQYYGVFPSQYIDEAIYYFSQVVTKPLFRDEDVEKERTIIIDELKSYEDEIDFKVVQGIKETRFITDQTPFSYDIIGTRKLLEYYSTQSLRSHWEKYYTPHNIEVYVLGNFDTKETKDLLEKHFGGFNGSVKEERNFKKHYPKYSKFRVGAKKKLDLDKYYLTLSFPGFDFKNTDIEQRNIIDFLKAITASPSFMHSVLWKRLRQELALVYGVYSWEYDMFSRSIFGVGTSFEKEHLETVLKEYYVGIEKIKAGDISKNVFESFKRKTLDTQLMKLDKPDAALAWISGYEDELEEHGKAQNINEYLDYVENLKFEEVIETANQIFDWDQANLNVVSRDDESETEKVVSELWSKLK